MQPWSVFENPERFDYVVVIVGLLHGKIRASSKVNAFLKAAANAQAPLVGLCTGSFILARAGLLEGYQVSVNWCHIGEFKGEFPSLRAESSHVFLIDRDRLNCVGGTSLVHLASDLIEKHCGRAQALKSLRILIEQQSLSAGAWQLEEIATRPSHDSLVKRAMLVIEQNIAVNTPTCRNLLLRVTGRARVSKIGGDIGRSTRPLAAVEASDTSA